jgi:hypothetical protein
MVQWLLLDRIDAKSAAPSIGGQDHAVAHPLPNETESALSFVELAKSRTKPALYAPVRQHRPPPPGIIRLPQLCDHCLAISLRKSDLARRGGNAGKEKRRNLQDLKKAAHESFPQVPSVPICMDSKEMKSANICGSN